MLFGVLILIGGLLICSVSDKIDLVERSIRKKIEESITSESETVIKKADNGKENDENKFTWRCSKCGKVNRIGTEYCVLCENPYYDSLRPSSPINPGQIPEKSIEEKKRQAYRLLENGKFDDAESLFDTVLAEKADDPQACFGKLMCQHKTRTISVVKNLSIDNDVLYQKVKPFATEEFFDRIRKLMN